MTLLLPYLIEGLDCSGKKAVAHAVQQRLADGPLACVLRIGPLVGGPLGQLDTHLANLTRPIRTHSTLGRGRRLLYTIGPIIDGIAYRPDRSGRVIKISSHYRAWARARVEGDPTMDRLFTATRRLHPRFAGVTLLATDFDTRVQRHRRDAATGRTTKVESSRFFGPDRDTFEAWHTTLDTLVAENAVPVQRLDTTNADIDALAAQVIAHLRFCWVEAPS